MRTEIFERIIQRKVKVLLATEAQTHFIWTLSTIIYIWESSA